MPTAVQKPASSSPASWVARRLLLLAAVLVMLCGCRTSLRQWCENGFKVGPNYCKPCVAVADDWIDADDKRLLQGPVDHIAWWSDSFQDPVLNQLVADAYRQNLTLRQAGARIAEARALRVVIVGDLFPQQQSFGAEYSHNLRTGFGDRHFSVWRGQFSLAWELDFWGRYRRAIEAADADLDASVFNYGDAVVTLVADVAATYIEIRTVQTQLKLVKSNVENQRRTFEFAEINFKEGAASEVDVLQAETNLAQTEAFVPQLELSLRQTQNQLCVLLGIPPQELTARLGEGKIPDVKKEVAVGIPQELLIRRPDVRRAERELAAQSALIGVAESDFYPHIALQGTLGRGAGQFKHLFEPGSGFGSVSPTLGWDFLNYGRILGSVHVQDARFQQLLAAYRESVLIANLEAENAIAEFLKTQVTYEKQLVAAEAADQTNEKIILLYREGDQTTDYNRVINVQSSKTQQETSAALAKGDLAQSLIAIYRALGGGWPSPALGDAMPVVPAGGLPPAPEELASPPVDGDDQPDLERGSEPGDFPAARPEDESDSVPLGSERFEDGPLLRFPLEST